MTTNVYDFGVKLCTKFHFGKVIFDSEHTYH